MSDDNKHISISNSADSIVDFNLIPDISVELRDDVLNEISAYCAEISQVLWVDFSSRVVPVILSMEWNNDLHLKFLEFRRLIDRSSVHSAAEAVLGGLIELVNDQKQ